MVIVCAALSVFFIFLAAEHALLRYARKQFTLIIHVNGTRGKSTVTRMIHALLRQHDMKVYGKTTGSTARLLLPDGTEKPIFRFAPANVREQRNMMILCAVSLRHAFSEKRGTAGTRQQSALVFECNAVQEELQQISMRWLKPHITIITNVREDHVQELGRVEQAAKAFARAIPEKSLLITSEKKFMDTWEETAKQKELKICYVDPHEADDFAKKADAFPENIACVLGLADHLGIARQKALKAIEEYRPDAGAFREYSWKAGNRLVFFADARAANDVESTDFLGTRLPSVLWPADAAAFHSAGTLPDLWRIFLLICREDRPDRTWHFLQCIINRQKVMLFDQYLCFGRIPLSSERLLKREGINYRVLMSIKDLDRILEETTEQKVYVFGVGNYGGPGKQVTEWLEKKVNQQ